MSSAVETAKMAKKRRKKKDLKRVEAMAARLERIFRMQGTIFAERRGKNL